MSTEFPQRPTTDVPIEKMPARLPWRALVAGIVLLPLLTFFGHLSYFVVQSSVWTAQTLLRGPLILLFLLVCWTLLWRRLSPRLARRLCLTSSEAILVYVMVAVGTALAGECWAVYVVPAIANTAAYQAESAQPQWTAWLGDVPRWFAVQDPEVIRAIHRGNSTLYTLPHLRALAVPVFCWGALMLALALFTQCLAQLSRKQWIDRERLSFPLAQLPLALVDVDSPHAWPRNRLFWAGVAVAGSIELINGLNYLFPNVPYIPVKVTRLPGAGDRPWSGLGSPWVAFYPWVIGVGYLVPLEVSFSLWFFFWFSRLQDLAFTMMGYRTAGGYAPGLPPYHLHQGTGAFLMLGLLLLWRIRGDLAGLWAKGRDPENRWAAWGMLACAGFFLAWAGAARIPWSLAGGFLIVYALFALVLGRLTAESGCPSSPSPLSVHETVALAGSIGSQSQQALVSFGWMHNLGERHADTLLPHQATGMRLAGDVGAHRWVHLFLGVGAVVGIAAGMGSLLTIYFHYGMMSAEVRDWPSRAAPQFAYRLIQTWLQGPAPIPRDQLAAAAAGAGITALLVWLRQTFLGWPLHPIGFVVAGNWGMQEIWCPFFVAWLAKLVALRFGGIRAYRALLPFFLGAILGDFLVPMLWSVIGLATGSQMYLSYPH